MAAGKNENDIEDQTAYNDRKEDVNWKFSELGLLSTEMNPALISISQNVAKN